jgi:hypothetical protein
MNGRTPPFPSDVAGTIPPGSFIRAMSRLRSFWNVQRAGPRATLPRACRGTSAFVRGFQNARNPLTLGRPVSKIGLSLQIFGWALKSASLGFISTVRVNLCDGRRHRCWVARAAESKGRPVLQ